MGWWGFAKRAQIAGPVGPGKRQSGQNSSGCGLEAATVVADKQGGARGAKQWLVAVTGDSPCSSSSASPSPPCCCSSPGFALALLLLRLLSHPRSPSPSLSPNR